jgi:hypothetical protein
VSLARPTQIQDEIPIAAIANPDAVVLVAVLDFRDLPNR